MIVNKFKTKLARRGSAIALIAALTVTQVAAASSINDAGLDLLGITSEAYDEAKVSAMVAYNAEMVENGWATAEKVERANERERWVRIGNNNAYYNGVLDQEAFIADALEISVEELDEAEDASYESTITAKVDAERMTEEKAAYRIAVYNFKDDLDKDAILVEALGITLEELESAREENISYRDLLESLDLSYRDVATNTKAIMENLVAEAVENGDLTEEQSETLMGTNNERGRRVSRRGR